MAEILVVEGNARGVLGTGGARAVRRQGLIPAVVYGNNQDPQAVAIQLRPIENALNKPGFYTKLFDLKIDGKSVRTIARDIQFHPVTDRILHLDFQRVDPSSTIRVDVPLVVVGHAESPGLKNGGVLNLLLHSIALECSIDNIPANLEVSLAGVEIGDSLHIEDIALPNGAKLVAGARDTTVYTITGASSEAAAAEGEAGAES
ncbi:MAG: 50S ribosomal protein L25/general stress protein Ctc [Holosporaceae bacterium]|jgi:large subunit ribosomal protein L25|nr:50S ribosomal protein L25/general stress protein Ctc [Rhodospirillaceae bacterium]